MNNESARATSQRELADMVGRSQPSVSRWMSRPDWPFRAGPWDNATVRNILKWAAKHLARGTPEVRQARMKLYAEQLATLKFQNQLVAGKLIYRDAVESITVPAIITLRQGLERAAFVLCFDIEKRPVKEIERQLAKYIEGLASDFETSLHEVQRIKGAASAGCGIEEATGTASEDSAGTGAEAANGAAAG